MSSRCLYCYEKLESGSRADFHPACSKRFFGQDEPPLLEYTLDQMKELAKEIVERSVTVPGVQPKLSLTLVSKVLGNNRSRLTVVGALGGNFILKPPSTIYPEMPANEHVTMRMAEDLGIRTVPSSLIRLASGELAYITKRIDRTYDGGKIHMLDMFQVTDAFDKYKSSMEKIGKAIRQHVSNTGLDVLRYVELVVFCFLTGNNDMHLKNFSLLLRDQEWMFSPAYDLLNVRIANPADEEDLALPVEGKKKKLRREHFLRLGIGLGLTERQINGIFNRAFTNQQKAKDWLRRSFLSKELKSNYLNLLDERYARLK